MILSKDISVLSCSDVSCCSRSFTILRARMYGMHVKRNTTSNDIRRNPITNTEKELNKLHQEIKNLTAAHDDNKKQLEPKQYHSFHSTDCTPASFYGLPKIHKPNAPLRPITSSIGSSRYNLSKDLVGSLSSLQNNKYTVKNNKSFANEIRRLSLDPDEVFISFDVVSRSKDVLTNKEQFYQSFW